VASKQAKHLRVAREEAQRGAPQSAARAPREPPSRVPLAPLVLPALATLGLLGSAALPRIRHAPWLAASVLAAAAVLFVLQLWLRIAVHRAGRRLHVETKPMPVHYVQATMQACIYAYWGWYWREVYAHVPLIVAQLLFAYALDMIVTWFRRDTWILGFGPFPIVLSTNLFMWFRDEWFFLQFLMVATGVLGKEFVKWNRDGVRTHVFNPSAISLFLFSLGLIVAGRTDITWGPDIAATLGVPPHIYVEVFLVGLVVQLLFSVTLVTLAATVALVALNLVYTSTTGTYHFVMTNIPIAVFLGLHLLVTDPATSPRTTLGKLAFGALYGLGAFALFGWFERIGVPTFYDKLLPVPVLNLTVRWLDRVSRRLAARVRALEPVAILGAKRLNVVAVCVWIVLFATTTATGFLGQAHPGRDPGFWRRACEEGRANACPTWVTFVELGCKHDPQYCNVLGRVLEDGRLVPKDVVRAAKSFANACDRGVRGGCDNLRSLATANGADDLKRACANGDQDACFIFGEILSEGAGVERNQSAALEVFRGLCARGWTRGCGRLGESYLSGEGTPADPAKAVENFDKACHGGHAVSCLGAAAIYRRGIGGLENDDLARQRLHRACLLGLQRACEPGDRPATADTVPDRLIDIQRLGG
jgi:Sel1 repeat